MLAQTGHLVGAPTYLPVGELAMCRPLAGQLPRPTYPDALAAAAPGVWEGRASVALMFAHGHARLGEAVSCTGMLSSAVLCVAHARLARRREWALNEKRLVRAAGLDAADGLRLRVGALEALDGTPVLDVKPVLGPVEER